MSNGPSDLILSPEMLEKFLEALTQAACRRSTLDQRRFLNLNQVSDLSGFSRRYVETEVAAGRLQVHRFGTSVRVSLRDFDAWVRLYRSKRRAPRSVDHDVLCIRRKVPSEEGTRSKQSGGKRSG